MTKCSKYHAKCKVTMPKCSKYHAKRQVLVPNCCKYKANGTRKESQKKSKTWGKKKTRIILHPFLGEVSHESFVFTSSTFRFWWKSRRKALFSHLPLSLVQGSLARKLRFHIFNFQILREVSHESVVFTSSTFTCSGKSHTNAWLVPRSGFGAATFYCALQLSLGRSHCNGCVKFAWCVRNTIVFCSWTS